jgi:hypothetical protein
MFFALVHTLCMKVGGQQGSPRATFKGENLDGNPCTKSTRHVEANVNTREEDQDNQNSSNEVEDVMLKGHPLPQIGS